MGVLYVVATPIGNLRDITLRALEVLKIVDVIYAEDTRITRRLLSHYNIHVPVRRYNEHAPDGTAREVIQRLEHGEQIALTSDAGTPGISDPGAVLLSYVQKMLPGVHIFSVPGPSAVIAALSVSGLKASEFTFLGYPPAKSKRKKYLRELSDIKARPVVFYESPYRLRRTLSDLQEMYSADYRIFIAKELTKVHEASFRGSVSEALNYFTGEKIRGEFVIIIP